MDIPAYAEHDLIYSPTTPWGYLYFQHLPHIFFFFWNYLFCFFVSFTRGGGQRFISLGTIQASSGSDKIKFISLSPNPDLGGSRVETLTISTHNLWAQGCCSSSCKQIFIPASGKGESKERTYPLFNLFI